MHCRGEGSGALSQQIGVGRGGGSQGLFKLCVCVWCHKVMIREQGHGEEKKNE